MTFQHVIRSVVVLASISAALFFQNCQKQSPNMESSSLKLSTKTCDNPWDATTPLSDGSTTLAFSSAAVPEGEFCNAQLRTCSGGQLYGTYEFPQCRATPAKSADCISPFNGGNVVANGKSVTAYKIDGNGECIATPRTCVNGALSEGGNMPACPGDNGCLTPWGLHLGEGDSIKTLDNAGQLATKAICDQPVTTWTCRATKDPKTLEVSHQLVKTTVVPSCDPDSCLTDWGQKVKNGTSIYAFKSAVALPGKCDLAANREKRTCKSGKLSGSFTFGQCREDSNPCAWNGGQIQNGTTVTAWNTNLATGGTQCLSEQRTCRNGVLSGTASYTFTSCSVSMRQCTAPWNSQQKYNHGDIVTAYAVNSVAPGRTCSPYSMQCIDSRWIYNGQVATFKYNSCHVACALPWGENLAHGSTQAAYSRISGTAAQCSAAKKTYSCQNGVLSGASTSVYKYKACTSLN